MSTTCRVIFVLTVFALMIGCSNRNSSSIPDQFPPPPGIFPDQVGKLVLERKWEKDPGCMRYGERVSCPGFYFDPADPDGSRIYYLVDIFKTPAEAVARLEESGGEKVIDATESVWEEDKKVGRLLVQSGIRNDGDQKTGSCVLSYIDGSMLIRIGSSVSCEAARAFFKGLTAM